MFCITEENPNPPREELIKKFVDKYLVPLVFSVPCKIITIIIFLTLIGLSFFGYTQLQLGLEQEVTVTEGSNLYLVIKINIK